MKPWTVLWLSASCLIELKDASTFCGRRLLKLLTTPLDCGVLHLDQHPQGGLHQDLLQKPTGRFRLLPFGTGWGQAGAGEGVVTGVQQAGHVGDDCEKHFRDNANVTKDSIKINLIIYRSGFENRVEWRISRHLAGMMF